MLSQSRRRWLNIKTKLGQWLVLHNPIVKQGRHSGDIFKFPDYLCFPYFFIIGISLHTRIFLCDHHVHRVDIVV